MKIVLSLYFHFTFKLWFVKCAVHNFMTYASCSLAYGNSQTYKCDRIFTK